MKTTHKRHREKLKVCLYITYLFLKALVFVSNVFLFGLLSHENLQSLPIVLWSVFSPESTSIVIQQSPLLYSANLFICVFFFYLFIYFTVIANILFSNRLLGTFFHRFRIPFRFPWFCFHFRIPDSGFRIPCFSAAGFLVFTLALSFSLVK